MTEFVSADTDDLDEFVEHGSSLQRTLFGIKETLGRQRSYLLGAGFPRVVGNSGISSFDNTVLFMADLDQFVEDISSSLKRFGNDLGNGVFQAPAARIEAAFAKTDDERLDRLEAALQAEGLSPEQAAAIREEVEQLLLENPRYQLDGATASEPVDLAAALVANIENRVGGLLEDNQVTSSELHAQARLSVPNLAADLYYGDHTDPLVPSDLLMEELRSVLTEEQYEDLQHELGVLAQREQVANASLAGEFPAEVELDGDLEGLRDRAQALYDENKVGLIYGGDGHRLDEPAIAYELQQLAEEDPGLALGMRWMLDGIMSPQESADLDRILAGDRRFLEGADVALANPRDGIIGRAKGAWNDNVSWWADYWADAEVAIANGFYGMATGSNPTLSPEVRQALPRQPESWEELDSVVELEFTLDNVAQQGGADLGLAVDVISGAYGGGRAGLSLVRIGRGYFLRSGDNIVAAVSPRLAAQLDDAVAAAPTGRGRGYGPDGISPTNPRPTTPPGGTRQFDGPGNYEGRFRHVQQQHDDWCGAACGEMAADRLGVRVTQEELANSPHFTQRWEVDGQLIQDGGFHTNDLRNALEETAPVPGREWVGGDLNLDLTDPESLSRQLDNWLGSSESDVILRVEGGNHWIAIEEVLPDGRIVVRNPRLDSATVIEPETLISYQPTGEAVVSFPKG